jgi:hypothetical protein
MAGLDPAIHLPWKKNGLPHRVASRRSGNDKTEPRRREAAFSFPDFS